MDLKTYFNPASIAIIGVSENPKKVGYLVAKNCIDQGYKGELYFINPKFDTLLGKKVYKSAKDIGKPVDLVVLAVPADISLGMMDELGSMGVKNILLYAAGFRETSPEGAAKELELIAKCKKYGITLLGPNCLGFVNTINGANLTFLKYPAPKGNIGLVSQSGALGSLMVDYLVGHKNFGFSYFISLGNKTIMDESDCLEFLSQDPDTKVIAMYLEDVKDGERFKKTLKQVTMKKPVIILKSGSTEEGSKAAVSHTGSMMGNDAVYSAVFSQCGAIRAGEFYEFMSLLKLFTYERVPTSKDILILSNAGGIGVLLTDELIRNQLSLVTITESAKQEIIQQMQGTKISFHNPIDLLGDASAFHYQAAIASTLKEKNIGAVIILLTPQANTEIEETTKVIEDAQERFVKPIYPVFMGEKSVGRSHFLFEEKKIASFSSYDFLPKAIAKILTYRAWIEAKQEKEEKGQLQETLQKLTLEEGIDGIFDKWKGQPFMDLDASMQVLKLAGVKTTRLRLAKSIDEAKQIVTEIGYPLVAKIASEKVTHKTEVKGIITNVENEQDLLRAWDKLLKIGDIGGVYLQKMLSGYELIIGAKRDRIFGVILMAGLGGIYAELLKETANFIYPIDEQEFTVGIKKTKLYAFVKGYRNLEKLDLSKLYNIVNRVGYLLARYPQISSIDINPLMVTHEGAYAVDSRIIL